MDLSHNIKYGKGAMFYLQCILNKLSLVFLPFFVLLSKLFHIDSQAIFIYIKITA